MSDCFVCTSRISTSASGVGEIKPYATAVVALRASKNTVSTAKLKAPMIRERGAKSKLNAVALIQSKHQYPSEAIAAEQDTATLPRMSADINLAGTWEGRHIIDVFEGLDSWDNQFRIGRPDSGLTAVGEIKPGMTMNANPLMHLVGSGVLRQTYADKFAGDFNDFTCVQKLYPSGDVYTSEFVNQNTTHDNLYQSVDEGIFAGKYHIDGEISDRYSDDRLEFITPSSIHTDNLARYTCDITAPSIIAKESRLFFRMAAPRSNWDGNGANFRSEVAHEFSIINIEWKDPLGDVVIHYEDIIMRGDADYYKNDFLNFGTYATKPKVNNFLKYQWQSGYPLLGPDTGYTLTFEVSGRSLDDPFDTGFDFGFEENTDVVDSLAEGDDYLAIDGAPLATQNQKMGLNPSNALRISAIEICNSGGLLGLGKEHYMPFYMEVRPSGDSLERRAMPAKILQWDYDSGVYPVASSVWTTPYHSDNTTASGAQNLINSLNYLNDDYYINLDRMDAPYRADSGRLTLQFSLDNLDLPIKRGQFGFGHAKSAFDVGDREELDTFFIPNRATLRVRARKESASIRDYSLDVVGWTDDRLLNISSPTGGFLQSTGGEGDYITTSGYEGPDLSLAGESFSSLDGFSSGNTPNNAGYDHYRLSTTPVVNTTDFAWYEIDLNIFEDTVSLGKSKQYNQSPNFESIYLDLFPLPSGAQISHMELCLKYSPSNGLNMMALGGDIGLIDGGREEGRLHPTTRQSTDSIINAGTTYNPLSTIESIPHAFTTPSSIKSNYSRRWRGVKSIVNGPFDPDMFAFGFDNPTLDHPFMSGLYNLTNYNGTTIYPEKVGQSLHADNGTLTTTFSDPIYKNVGWRFKTQDIFDYQKPGWSSDYKTTDWTALSDGGSNFNSHELYGKIADAFDSVVRVSGANSYITLGNGQASNFAAYARITPDISITGVGYNLYNSGCVLSKWDNGKELEFAIGYENGYLAGFARATDGSIVKVKDTALYNTYQYPVSVLLTYNADNKLRLYTDNELENSWTVLRATSTAFTAATGDSYITVGHSHGSGVGINAFVSEFGISNSGNIVESLPDATKKEITAEQFLENTRVKFWDTTDSYTDDSYKLWDRINEATSDWDLGAFSYCAFNQAFDWWTKRPSKDYVTFDLKHAGSGYYPYANIDMPTTVDSGVAYHTQIENDFLRFNLSDAASNLYAVAPRIQKSLPKGYDFSERAMVVESVVQHQSDREITWPDGSKGPKLIVSLYTKNQEPDSYPTTNYGLVNRDIHYLESGCIHRVDSKFDFNSYVDETEQWALFPHEKRLTEFNHKYFSKDVDKMFLQYDLAYPSGESFEARLDLHTAHVKLDAAYVNPVKMSGDPLLYTSGEFRTRADLSLYAEARSGITSSGLDSFGNFYGGPTLVTSGPNLITSSGLNSLGAFYGGPTLVASGGAYEMASMNLYAKNSAFAYSSGIDSLGEFFGGPTVFTSGGLPIATGSMELVVGNYDESVTSGTSITMTAYGGQDGHGDFIQSAMRMSLKTFDEPSQIIKSSGSFTLLTEGAGAAETGFASGDINFYMLGSTQPSSILPLYLSNFVTETEQTASVNMYLMNSKYVFGRPSFLWDSSNFGSPIDVDDNTNGTLFAKADNDEIRGVDTTCFGGCAGSGCQEVSVVTHDTTWFDPECIDGGVIRPKATYTNQEYSYSGEYYGLRKFTGLEPNHTFDITISGVTGNEKSLVPPREFEEWEYGTNEDVAYSGFKLIGDYPFAESGRKDSANDNYGTSVDIKGDLMIVGSPHHKYDQYGSGLLTNAGAVFTYRRKSIANSGQKYFWDLEDKIVLPSGFRDDSYTEGEALSLFPGLDPIPTRNWNVGQEGREFGTSISVASSGSKEVIVVGAPKAVFSRDFDADVATTEINAAIMVVTDEFKWNETRLEIITDLIRKYNLLFKYYASEPARLNVKIIVCEAPPHKPTIDKPGFIYHQQIDRNGVGGATSASILQGLKDGFNGAFPLDATKRLNNLPPILGIYVDPTPSFGRDSVEPAIDDFKEHYYAYTLANGVTDRDGAASKGYIYEKFFDADKDENPEDWIDLSKTTLEDILDTGRLIEDNALRFITNNIGSDYVNEDLERFNNVPPSGGRAYIFEKESGIWTMVQEIKPSYETQYQAPDRFGWSVSISDNSEVVTIGSPYSQNSCLVYEQAAGYKKELHNSVLKWLEANNKTTEIQNYRSYVEEFGADLGKERSYLELSAADRAKLRDDQGIEQYKVIYKYGYEDIGYTGTWQFLATMGGIPTSRLGWSTTVNEDGSLVAFGAPTDSLNQFEDTNAYFRKEGFYGYDDEPVKNHERLDGWSTSTYAGAVRVFGSRKYHPHSGVVEYFKFGNLDMNYHTEDRDAGRYNTLEEMFDDRTFTRTQFSDLEIPRSAGLAFIITPEVDAASDEIMQNIKDWLSLGDRTLVLVGNDPVYEENGLYKDSNDVINKILNNLGSKMRIQAAQTREEAVNYCAIDSKPNVIQSRTTVYMRNTDVLTGQMFASGVGDIKIHIPDWDNLPAIRQNGAYDTSKDDVNKLDLLPMIHNGDLRANKKIECLTPCEKPRRVFEYINWGYHFGNGTMNCCPDIPQQVVANGLGKSNTEPRPLLSAAEWTPEETIVFPEVVEKRRVPITKKVITKKDVTKKVYSFGQHHINNKHFEFSSDVYTGLDGVDYKNFEDPDPLNSRDGIMQGVAGTKTDVIEKVIKVSPDSPLVTQENIYGSRVIFIAAVTPEEQGNMYAGLDDNIVFYNNILTKDCQSKSRIAQLGGWTGRTSFVDAYSKSHMKVFLDSKGYDVTENYTGSLATNFDVAWVANPAANPADTNIADIKNWLGDGNKTLVVTFDTSQEAALAVEELSNGLGLSMKPLYLNGRQKFANSNADALRSLGGQTLDKNSPLIKGCTSADKVTKFNLTYDNQSKKSFTFGEFTVIDVESPATKVITNPTEIADTERTTETFWRLKPNVATMSIPVEKGSGYRLFYNWVSEDDTENHSIKLLMNETSNSPDPRDELFKPSLPIVDFDDNDTSFILAEDLQIQKTLGRTGKRKPTSEFVDFRVPADHDGTSITLYVDGNKIRAGESTIKYTPKTVRLLSVSGALLPINEEVKTFTFNEEKEVIIGWKEETVVTHPETTVVIPSKAREIKSREDKVADGPVVAAIEPETFSTFTQGRTRSNIILLTDSSMVQNMCDSGQLYTNKDFVKSLYPKSMDILGASSAQSFSTPSLPQGAMAGDHVESTPDLLQLHEGERKFEFQQKIIAPERSTPAKLWAVSGIVGSVSRFQGESAGVDVTHDRQPSGFFIGQDPLPAEITDRPKAPIKESQKKSLINALMSRAIGSGNAYAKFSGVYDGELHGDAGAYGGLPKITAEHGIEYLDFDYWQSGYPGDLFGYSIAMRGRKLVVGTPFNIFSSGNIYDWEASSHFGLKNTAKLAGIDFTYNGGAGAAFYYENSGEGYAWDFKKKLRPGSINAGFDDYTDSTASNTYIGSNDYTATDRSKMMLTTDQFGYDVGMDADFIAVGAPGHDFDNHYEDLYDRTVDDIVYSGCFIRKEFDAQFDIPTHTVFDMGESGVRAYELSGSGTSVLNNGAVFTFERKVNDWGSNIREWEFVEKIIAQGHKSRLQKDYAGLTAVSGAENDRFGTSVAIDRARRSDGDYTMAVGAPYHMFATSGNHQNLAGTNSDEVVLGAGAAYTYDAMLRGQPPTSGSPESFIDAKVFGLDKTAAVDLLVQQSGDTIFSSATGTVTANSQGEIFIEMSGRDTNRKGFIQHRPYIYSIGGVAAPGTDTTSSMSMAISGKPLSNSGDMSLYMLGQDNAKVYNNISLVVQSNNVASGSPILYTSGVSAIASSGFFTSMFTSGTFIMGNQFNLAIRGK